MKCELDIAIDELNDTVELLNKAVEVIINLRSDSPDEIVEKVAGINPSLIEQIRIMDGPPKNTLEFWVEFGAWTVSRLHDKYAHIWPEVQARRKTDFVKKTSARAKLKTRTLQSLERRQVLVI